MKTNLLDISDGILLKNTDYAKIGCNDCKGCSDCCTDMGQSILLDPYDVHLICKNLGTSFEALLTEAKIELHSESGLILPNLKMVPKSLDKSKAPSCAFLNREGRCSIHEFRPGICRLFPLGRNYSPASMDYFVLKDACPAANGEKVRIYNWLEYRDIDRYEQYLVSWHNLTKQVRELVISYPSDQASAIMNGFIKLFFMTPFDSDDFFKEFENRVNTLI